MRHKINIQLLANAQKYASQLNHPLLLDVHSTYYEIINKLYTDITKKFKKICIHGNYPHLFIPTLENKNNQKFQQLSLVGSIIKDCPSYASISDQSTFNESDKFDLIISCMEIHKSASPQNLLKMYINALEPDGAMIGCCLGQKSFNNLYRAYLLAENQRSGGVSPRLLSYPSIGYFGNILTTTKFQLPTIVANQYQLQFQSVLDLLSLFQISGESGIVRGRRKGIFKDLLLAMSAIYDVEKPIEMLQVLSFIGWKYSENQPKSLRRGQLVEGKTFVSQLKQHDSNLKQYLVKEGEEEPTQIK